MAGTGDGRRHQLILLISDLDFINALAWDQTLVRGKFLGFIPAATVLQLAPRQRHRPPED
jgi:hypothetical protein